MMGYVWTQQSAISGLMTKFVCLPKLIKSTCLITTSIKTVHVPGMTPSFFLFCFLNFCY